MKRILPFLLIFFFLFSPLSFARHRSGSHSRHSSYHYTSHRSSYHHSTSHRSSYHRTKSYSYKSHSSSYHKSRSNRCSSCPRDSRGRIKRSATARKDFMKQTGYPHGRKGYVIDHVRPLKRGGSDSPSNMQWQTKEAAKAKDKTE